MSNQTHAAMPPRQRHLLRAAWFAERAAARSARASGDVAGEWRHLERAHVLSQAMPVAHVRTHLAMLAYGIRRHDRLEVVGQLRSVWPSPVPARSPAAVPSATPAGSASASLPSCRSQTIFARGSGP